MQTLSLETFLENRLTPDSLDFINPFLQLLEKLPACSRTGPWIVGGTIRRICNHEAPSTDIDVMFRNPQQFDDYCGALRERGAETVDESERQITFKLGEWEVQPIRAEFSNTLIQTLNKFDFTICQFGFDGTNLVWGDHSMDHVKEGKLVFTQTGDYLSSMRRAFKYAKQGFYMDQDSIAKFLKKATENAAQVKTSSDKWEAEAKASGGFLRRSDSVSSYS